MESTLRNRYLAWFGIHGALLFAIVHFFGKDRFLLALILFFLVFFGFVKDIYDAWRIQKGKDSLFHPYFEHMPLSVLIFAFTLFGFIFEQRSEFLITCVLAGADAFVDYQTDKKCCKI